MLVLSPRWAWCAETGLREGVHIVIEGNRVADVTRERPTGDAGFVELEDGLAIPGLINLHNHVFSAPLFRGLADDIRPGDLPGHIVFSLLMPLGDLVAAEMAEEAIGDAAEMALLACLQSGTTAMLDVWRPQQRAFIARANGLGLRTWSCPYLFTRPNLSMTAEGKALWMGEDASDASFDFVMRLHAEAHGVGLASVGFGPHGPDSCSPELLRRIERAAREMGAIVSIHCAQNPIELAAVEAAHGRRSVAHLRDLGLLRPGTVLAHMMFATEDEVTEVRDHGAAIASCPLAFARSGRGVPVARFLESGVRLGIGTDGVTLDMVEELRAAALLAKTQSGAPAAGTAERLLTAATRDAADALLRPDLGRLTRGATADIAVFDLGAARYQPVWDPLKALLTNGSGADAHTVVTDGVIRLHQGRPAGRDARAIVARGRRAIEDIWDRAAARGAIPPGLAARRARTQEALA
ncbi:MAG: amidohydrolase family protein [Acetobacteraceae bacterium]|nr:amidohydrolase family protein [Acetobacteraceae bacterium]